MALKPEEVKDRKELVKKMEDVVTEYGGEANIPVTHEYWQIGNQLRALNQKEKDTIQHPANPPKEPTHPHNPNQK